MIHPAWYFAWCALISRVTALLYSFSNLEPVCCSMSGSNCCFLICIHVSQETGKVVCYFHLFKNFPHFVVIHTVKGFSIVNEAEIDVFLELSCFLNDRMDVGNLIPGSSAFSKSSLNIWKFMVHILLKPNLDNLASSFFGIGMKTAFPALWPLLSFLNLLAYWVQHFHSIIFQDMYRNSL